MWIVRDLEAKAKSLPIFYKRFTLNKKIAKCEMKISALGIFSVCINGQRIKDYFMPGWTSYNSYVNLCTYDITREIKKQNEIAIILADGWYSGRLGYTKQAKVYGEINALYADICLYYTDGTQERICTDSTWRVGETQIVSSSFFDGETVDFTLPKSENYDSLPFAKEYGVKVKFEDYTYEPCRKVCEIRPTVISRTKNKILLDFKQNMAGFITFKAKGERGDTVTLKHAEVLNENGSLYLENLRSVKATDRVILSGGSDVFEPLFTFHGFRYAQIKIKGNVKISDIKGIVISQDQNYHGRFECSSKLINKIHKNVLWGQRGNFISIPIDCPQRDERLGWTGDAEVFCNSAMFNCDCNDFFKNYLKLIRTDILPDGKIPSFVPFFIPVSPSTAGVPGWADAICVIPYTHYVHYKDKSVIEENLPYALRHLNYYLGKCNNYLIDIDNTFGDWLSTKIYDDKGVINQCHLGLSALLISKMFRILEDGENAKKYAEIYEGAKEAFRNRYLSDNGLIEGDSQTAYALSLMVGFVTADEIREHFIDSIKREDYKLTTGFIGVKQLLPALCEIGEVDLAYRIIKQTEYPSWGYTIKQGATTIWERWNGYTSEHGFETPSMNSFNHYSLGSCAEWLYSHVLGIKLSEKDVITVSPSLSKELRFASGEYLSKNGKIRVFWKVKKDKYYLTVTADKGVEFDVDFSKYEAISSKRRRNTVKAVLK